MLIYNDRIRVSNQGIFYNMCPVHRTEFYMRLTDFKEFIERSFDKYQGFIHAEVIIEKEHHTKILKPAKAYELISDLEDDDFNYVSYFNITFKNPV